MDVFVGGAAKLKDSPRPGSTQSSSSSSSATTRHPFQLTNSSTTPARASKEVVGEPTGLQSKFKQRGVGGGASAPSPSSTPTGGPATPHRSLFSFKPRSDSQQKVIEDSPPPPTPPSSGEQMPPPPVASQRHVRSNDSNAAHRHSTSTGSSSSTLASDIEQKSAGGGRYKGGDENGARSALDKQQQQHVEGRRGSGEGGQAGSSTQLTSREALAVHKQPQQISTNGTPSRSSDEDEEETPLMINEDAPSPSPFPTSFEQDNEQLVMSGDVGDASYAPEEDADADDDDSSSEEDEVLVAGVKREREYTEDEGEYKRRDHGQRLIVSMIVSSGLSTSLNLFLPQEPEHDVDEYQDYNSHTPAGIGMDVDHHQVARFDSFAPTSDGEQQQQGYVGSLHLQHYSPHHQQHQQSLEPQLRRQFDPLTPVAELFPGPLPYLQQAQARLQHDANGVEGKWDGCTLDEWKEGGEEMVQRFSALMGRVVALVA